MKLYRKQLNSVDELKREMIRLRYERRQTKTSDLNPIAEVGKKKGTGVATNNFLGLLMSLISAGSHTERVMKVAPHVLNLLGKKKKKYKEEKEGKSFLQKVAVEVITVYLIGKGVQVGVHVIKKYLRKKKEKARLEKEVREYIPIRNTNKAHW